MNRLQELEAKLTSGESLTPEEQTELEGLRAASSPESTPPTPIPAPSPTDQTRYVGILEETLREQNRQIQELMAGNRAPAAAAAPAAPSPEEEKTKFYNDPVNTTRSIVTEALREAIAPLNDFVRGLKIDGSPYANMLGKFRADARFAETLSDPHVLAAVERIMEKAELNEVNMQSAIVHASGLKSMGLLGTVAPAPAGAAPSGTVPAGTPPTPPASTVLPPHVRPSAAPTPQPSAGNGAVRRPPLTENQRRIMRENNIKTEAEYWTWMEMDAADVAGANFDKPKPAGTR